MGWTASRFEAQLRDLLRALDNFFAGDFWRGRRIYSYAFSSKVLVFPFRLTSSKHSIKFNRRCVKELVEPGVSYPWCVFLHLVLVAMGARGMPLPEALLTELVIMALLATVAKSHHALAVAVGAFNWVEDYGWRTQHKPSCSVYSFPMDSSHPDSWLCCNWIVTVALKQKFAH